MDYLSTHEVAELFRISSQTVKNYADNFGDFLSPTATPGRGRRRVFVADDLKVFALLADYHERGHTYEDARLALAAGQRGDIPTLDTQLTIPPAIMLQMRDEIASLRQQLTQANTRADQSDGQIKLLREMLAEKERRIEELIRGG